MCSLLVQHAIFTYFAIEDTMNCVNGRNFHIGCASRVLSRKCNYQSIQEHSCPLSNVCGKDQDFNFCPILSVLNNASVCAFLDVMRDVCRKLGALEAVSAAQSEHVGMSTGGRV